MSCEDWRAVPESELAPLYARERERWLAELSWDTHATWTLVEQGRRAGRVPGFVVRSGGEVVGWSFFSVDRGTAHLGFVDGDRAETVRELIDQVLDAPEAAYVRRYQAFLFPRTSAVAVALQRRRFVINPQLLLGVSVNEAPAPWEPGAGVVPGRPWESDDLAGFVRLLARAYAGTPVAEAFAPQGLLEEWVSYVAQVVNTPACGAFLPEGSVVIPGVSPDRPAGAVLTTRIADGVWHIAQVATDPGQRRRGLARQMVQRVCASARAAGARRVTLVVDERNEAARRLYDGLGFQQVGTMLLASRGRVTRVATHNSEAAVAS